MFAEFYPLQDDEEDDDPDKHRNHAAHSPLSMQAAVVLLLHLCVCGHRARTRLACQTNARTHATGKLQQPPPVTDGGLTHPAGLTALSERV